MSNIQTHPAVEWLIGWLEKQRSQNLDMVTDAGDASRWCKDEADKIADYIKTVRGLATENKRLREALNRIWNPVNWDETKGGNWWGESHPRKIAFAAIEGAKETKK